MKKLNDKQKKLVEENHNIIFYILKLRELNREDFYDIAAIGLCKAALLYDESRGIQFSTLACTCINNEINYYFRYINSAKYAINNGIMSYNCKIKNEDDETNTEIIDMIPGNSSVEQEIMAKYAAQNAYNKLTKSQKKMFNVVIKHGTIKGAKLTGFSRSWLGLAKTNFKKNFKNELHN